MTTVLTLLIMCITGLLGYSLYIAHNALSGRPKRMSRRVSAANQDAMIAEQEVRTARANAEKDVIEAKRRQLLDSVLEKDNAREEAVLRQLEQTRRP